MISVAHVGPVYKAVHEQINPFPLLKHYPLFTHGQEEEQSAVPTLHVIPVNPGAHIQRKLFCVFEQVPPFKHGNVEQRFVIIKESWRRMIETT